jgi:group I intron endonuclease
MKHYIYKITCIITGKFYYGMHSTEFLDDGYFGSGKILIRSVKKYGRENHLLDILEFLPDREKLKQREKEIVNEVLIKDPLCMNLKIGGEGGGEKGVFRSNETRAKMSATAKSKPRSKKQIAVSEKAALGYRHSEETRMMMSKTRKGRKLPPFSDEHLKKLSEARKKRIISDETKLKISESFKKNNSHIGWNLTEDSRNKQKNAVSKALTGKSKMQVICPHCLKIGGKPAMIRFHFDKCKELICV